MMVEVPGKESGYAPSEAELLETLFISTLWTWLDEMVARSTSG